MPVPWSGNRADVHTQTHARTVVATGPACSPRLLFFYCQVMRRLAPQLSLDEERLNVSCLLYSPGQCILGMLTGTGAAPVSRGWDGNHMTLPSDACTE